MTGQPVTTEATIALDTEAQTGSSLAVRKISTYLVLAAVLLLFANGRNTIHKI